ncbi:DUF2167 domain-containing protein [Desulfogranum japonicum]|uniref:DUF2167 domain-containing protein n=1 Tax=Desulfogranum japonicum TaxID=231447 RepID=UPI0004073645|nr:DUF2167 domain-containing protein [Desulfogranum japonicum]
MKQISVLLCFLFFMFAAGTAQSGETQPQEGTMTVEEFVASLNLQQGTIVLPGDVATLTVPESFYYLGPEDTERVLVQAWGNPDGSGTLGMLFPVDTGVVDEGSWAVVISYEQDGYVSDEDADSIDYTALMQDMKKAVAEANKQRTEQGYEAVTLVGWAAEPFYDKTEHKLYWAKELAFGDDENHTLNYNIRVLGRKGVMVLNAVAGIAQLDNVSQEMPSIMSFTEFNPGYRYDEFNPTTDKKAAYGLAALVAGGVAAKAGLFGKLFAVLIALKKAIIPIIVGGGAMVARLFKKKG